MQIDQGTKFISRVFAQVPKQLNIKQFKRIPSWQKGGTWALSSDIEGNDAHLRNKNKKYINKINI